MDLPQIGAHCALESCNVLDFLPIACQCDQKFCSEHSPPDRHACPLLNAVDRSSTFSDKIRRCQVERCNKPSLGNDDDASGGGGTCALCSMQLCTDHRFPDLHGCPSLVDKVSNTRPAKAASSSPRPVIPTRKPPKDPVKLAQWRKLELMKMRHRACPADPRDRASAVPIDQRIHVRVVKGNEEKPFWLRKSTVAGKAIDLLVDNLKLTFPENTPLQFSAAPFSGGEPIILRNDLPLSEQVEDGSLLTVRTRQQEDS